MGKAMTLAQIILMAAPYAIVIVASAAIFLTAAAIHNHRRFDRIIRRRISELLPPDQSIG